jgi:tryptophan-rich sensory protein
MPVVRIDGMPSYAVLALFLVLTLGGGIAIGFTSPPGNWYAQLRKPAFNPPNRAFAPAWTILYILIAIAGWRTWVDGPGIALALWAVQLALNFAWSPTFFRAHRPRTALAIVLALLATIVVFIAVQAQRDLPAALLFVPYAAWVAFASLLNASILRLNRGVI